MRAWQPEGRRDSKPEGEADAIVAKRERRMRGQEDVRVTEGKGRARGRLEIFGPCKTVPVGVRVRARVSLDPPSPLAFSRSLPFPEVLHA